jgi:hypothetical protein
MESKPISCDHMFHADVIENARLVEYKARYKTISMQIDDFLSMIPPSLEENPKSRRVAGMIERGETFNAIPFLILMCDEDDGATARVYGHEGRHRAMALRTLGYEEMPVILRTDIRWSEQDNVNSFDYRDVWPTTLVGSSREQVRIPFPVPREDAAKSYTGPVIGKSDSANQEKDFAPSLKMVP